MRKLRLGAAFALAGVLLVGCHPGQVRQAEEQKAHQVAYDPTLGQQTLVYDGLIYQTVGQPMEGDVSDLVAVGTSEGFVLYQLPGGGAGGAARNLLFIRTVDGRFQALQPIGSMPMQRQQEPRPDEGMDHSMPE